VSAHRQAIITEVNEAMQAGARQSAACEIIGISAKTLQRWEQPDNTQDGRLDALHEPSTKLTQREREQIIKVANEPDYAALSPSKIVPKLADEGRYIASESSFYRVLKSAKQLTHRLKAKPTRTVIKPEALTASGPNQIYSWDITYLPTRVRGIFLYLYLVMDIYSRKVVGWQVYEEESSALAADLMTDICHREGVKRHCVTLHSDNGSPMKGATLLATLHKLGVIPSFSRPSVSNDNPYSESLFRTLKYRPEYPEEVFASLHGARTWVRWFVDWYNNEHLHSSIQFVTPAQRHAGHDADILAHREQVYRHAKAQHPQRWSGNIRNWKPVGDVHLNPGKNRTEIKKNKAA
jgi:transposase InsO family protein